MTRETGRIYILILMAVALIPPAFVSRTRTRTCGSTVSSAGDYLERLVGASNSFACCLSGAQTTLLVKRPERYLHANMTKVPDDQLIQLMLEMGWVTKQGRVTVKFFSAALKAGLLDR